MVATKLSQVAGKGWGWYSGSSSAATEGPTVVSSNTSTTHVDHRKSSRSRSKPVASPALTPQASGSSSTQASSSSSSSYVKEESSSSTTSTPSKYYDYWNEAVEAVEQTYSSMSDYIMMQATIGWSSRSVGTEAEDDNHRNNIRMRMENNTMPSVPPREASSNRKSSILLSPFVRNLFHNPYVTVRGHHQPHLSPVITSMEAIRSLLHTVPAAGNTNHTTPTPTTAAAAGGGDAVDTSVSEASSSLSNNNNDSNNGSVNTEASRPDEKNGIGPLKNLTDRDPSSVGPQQQQQHSSSSTASETASQLAEGTLRAYRDIALDEAVELHEALRYWSYRWERPFLSWLEAGPPIWWFSEKGYDHRKVGQKVSQIQAVLARRCATIGELQSHLLRAGWQRGVAEWGMLGGEWATVAGNDGRMGGSENNNTTTTTTTEEKDDFAVCHHPPILLPPPSYPFRRISSEMIDHMPPPPSQPRLPRKGPSSNVSELPHQTRHNSLYYTNVFVKNNDGGHIMIDDPALAEWSVDAISLVRRQLYRAANGQIVLPFTENWAEGDDQSRGSYDPTTGSAVPDSAGTVAAAAAAATDSMVAPGKLPLWAALKVSPDEMGDSFHHERNHVDDASDKAAARIHISDLPLLVNEVSELLDMMESVIEMQRSRRLEKLKPPSWIHRNWYVGALSVPPMIYFVIKGAKRRYGLKLLRSIKRYIVQFFREHVVDPLYAMYDEFTKGTVDISDRQARDVAIRNLQKMIRSWLDETHPDMPHKQRRRMAKSMDISLIEAEKAESMKTLYNINSVIRMSFIEAQFLKKEMMNALLAIDEMRASTNFNMNMAAVTPFVLAVVALQKTFKFVYYAILKMGKSREETFGSFFHLLIEIERLLIMRDNPPAPPTTRPSFNGSDSHTVLADCLLNANDLGMLMLHIHELRTVLWQDRRRFSQNIIRSVAEDLAELAGERGAVSVRQQLQIISRMCRTYPFLRAVDDRMFDHQYR